jgi:hypothetical protein
MIWFLVSPGIARPVAEASVTRQGELGGALHVDLRLVVPAASEVVVGDHVFSKAHFVRSERRTGCDVFQGRGKRAGILAEAEFDECCHDAGLGVFGCFHLSDDLVLVSLGGCLAWETLKRTSQNRATSFSI